MHSICSLYVSKNLRIYRINCQICSLPRGNLCAGIAVPLEPFWITQNNWPSGKFRITLPQVKFLGGGSILLARLPLPFPLLPWQSLQAVGFASSEKSFLPFFNIFFSRCQWIHFFKISARCSLGFSILRTDPRNSCDNGKRFYSVCIKKQGQPKNGDPISSQRLFSEKVLR